jgi:hypothetical protein
LDSEIRCLFGTCSDRALAKRMIRFAFSPQRLQLQNRRARRLYPE